MRHNHLITPEGTRDLLYSECAMRRAAEKAVCKLFAAAGYSEVRTPELEFSDVFALDSEPIPLEQMYKLTDSKGRLLVLRPDSTMPIARMVATKLKSAARPLRLYYNQSCYRISKSLRGGSDQIRQVGIELIGPGGLRADIEVLRLAIEALSACTPQFKLEIGSAGIFKALIARLPVDEHRRAALLRAIESKNYAALTTELESIQSCTEANALAQLPRLFGGVDVLDRARKLFGGDNISEELRSQLDYLGQLYAALEELGLGDKISIDLGLVRNNDYYTGIVFAGYAQGSGLSVLGGGRYDSLLGQFGAPECACGFAINIDALVDSPETLINTPSAAPEILVVAGEGKELEAIRYIASLQREGHSAEFCVLDNIDDALRYAGERGIQRLDIVKDSVETILPGGDRR
ncbi:MAG: ATP phosphoribosyltransferase regulatory subunit [Ruminococcaceae bacterium]|nr:ATP phosphoribosyltransferase regulatory subunit [Oscillospiraceae bacterium]